MNTKDMHNIFNFVLKNKQITLSKKSPINRDTMIEMFDNLKKSRNRFSLNERQIDQIKRAFINGKYTLCEETPEFICTDSKCVLSSIKIDIYTIKYAKTFTKSIINECINQSYVLNSNSPDILRSNFEIIMNSIKKSPNTVNYARLASLSYDQIQAIIDVLKTSDYIINSQTSSYLTKNIDIVKNSIFKSPYSVKYANYKIKYDIEIVKFLLDQNIDLRDVNYGLGKVKISDIDSFDLFKKIFKRLDIDQVSHPIYHSYLYTHEEYLDKFVDRFCELFYKIAKTMPTISGFKGIFEYIAEEQWNSYKESNMDYLVNVFGKICSELQDKSDFDDVELGQIKSNMKLKLGIEKYNILINSMKKYHEVYHNPLIPRSEIDESRDLIAKLSAEYIAMYKETYKKELINNYFDEIKRYFNYKIDNPTIKKRITRAIQKEKFKKRYIINADEVLDLVNKIIAEFSDKINEAEIKVMIRQFIIENESKLDKFIKAPRGFTNYNRFIEVKKIINRLNSNYIKYTDLEVSRYKDIISYDKDSQKYFYDGPTFTDEQVQKFHKYKEKQQIFEKIKQKIALKTKSIEVDINNIDINRYDEYLSDLPFTDEYFEVDREEIDGLNYDIDSLIDNFGMENEFTNPECFIDDEVYSELSKFMINNNVYWLLHIIESSIYNEDLEEGFTTEDVVDIMEKMKDIVNISKLFNHNIESYDDIRKIKNLSECSGNNSIAVLGIDTIEKICNYQEYVESNMKRTIEIATNLACEMSKRSKSTVPYVEGDVGNYHYSIYDTQDVDLLLAGINTSACFRAGGYDNDFLHYCALNKNGVVIKITDKYGNFIGRAAGFRNGNAVYFNQLRTINDIGGSGYMSSYINERQEIIETFNQACKDIITKSMENEADELKIKYIFVTQSYAMSRTSSNVSSRVTDIIGSRPMVNESEDWKSFVKKTQNLKRCGIDDGFSVDYGGYALICMQRINDDGKIIDYKEHETLENAEIIKTDVPAVYKRPRSKIVVTDKPDENIIKKINKIIGTYTHFWDVEFTQLNIIKGSTVYIGDNWFIIVYNNELLYSLVLDSDSDAIREHMATIDVLKASNIRTNDIIVKLTEETEETENENGRARERAGGMIN